MMDAFVYDVMRSYSRDYYVGEDFVILMNFL